MLKAETTNNVMFKKIISWEVTQNGFSRITSRRQNVGNKEKLLNYKASDLKLI